REVVQGLGREFEYLSNRRRRDRRRELEREYRSQRIPVHDGGVRRFRVEGEIQTDRRSGKSQRRNPVPFQTDSEQSRSDWLSGRHGAKLLGIALRRIATAEDSLRPEPRRIEEGSETRRLERLRDPGRRQARPPLDQRLPDR